jgi:hypothetical protein
VRGRVEVSNTLIRSTKTYFCTLHIVRLERKLMRNQSLFKFFKLKTPVTAQQSKLLDPRLPPPVALRSKGLVCGCSLTGITVSNTAGVRLSVSCKCCVCYQVEVSASGWLLVQRRPTDCGVSAIVKPRYWGGPGPLGDAAPWGKKLPFNTTNTKFHHAQYWGTRWHSWLRYYATSRKVAGSIPDGVVGIFH